MATTCGNVSPSIGGSEHSLCELLPGHVGAHQNGGTTWVHHITPTKVPTAADGLIRLALAVERLAGAIERHR